MNEAERILSPAPAHSTPAPTSDPDLNGLSQKDLQDQTSASNQLEIFSTGDKSRQKSHGAADDSLLENEIVTSAPEKTSARGRGRPVKGVERLIYEIAIGKTLKTAASRAGLSERTAQRRWAEREFMFAVLSLRRQMRSRATGRISVLMIDAVKVLKKALESDVRTSRISAARTLLRFGHSFGAQAEELALLEKKLDEAKEEIDKENSEGEPAEDQSW
jgi:hypothetical protein